MEYQSAISLAIEAVEALINVRQKYMTVDEVLTFEKAIATLKRVNKNA